jgi:hypothetical protein
MSLAQGSHEKRGGGAVASLCLCLSVFLAFASGGCATHYVYGRTGEITPPPKPPGCTFTILDVPPEKPFDEVGVLAPKDVEFGDMAGGATPFKEAVADQVCAAGGDAVVVERDFTGRYIRGTVIKFKP